MSMTQCKEFSMAQCARTIGPTALARGFAPLSKLGHPRRERRLHDGGIDIPQGVLGSERTLRPRGGFVRRGEARELAHQPIAQGG